MNRAAARADGLACVLLAAGGSRRLGVPKQLLRVQSAPLLLRAVLAAHAATEGPIVVVLGAHALKLRALLRRHGAPVRVAHNARWEEGLAASLRVGLTALPPRTRAALVLVVDQPLIDARAAQRLVRAWRRRPSMPAAAHYAGRAGVPAILPRRTWRALRSLRGDTGARALLNGSGVTLVCLPEAALDVDTPEDVTRLRHATRRAARAQRQIRYGPRSR